MNNTAMNHPRLNRNFILFLQQKYGEIIGMEVWKVFAVIKYDDEAEKRLLNALDGLFDDEQRRALISKIWDRYYEQVADSVIGD